MKKLVVAVLAVLLLVIPIAGAGADASYVHQEKIDVVGGWSCPDGQKIEDPATGSYPLTFTNADGRVFPGTIDITVNPDNTFHFETDHFSHVVDSVLVKGGPSALLWSFNPGTDSWLPPEDGLHAPLNEKNGKFYELSHLCFLTEKKGRS